MIDVYLRAVPAGSSADPWLYDPTLPDTAATLPRDDKPARRAIRIREQRPGIEAVSLFGDLVSRYGITDGHRIYWAMRDERKGPFQPGAKYDPARHQLRLRRVRRLPGADRRKPDA